METLHLCYSLHDPGGRYTKFLGTSLLSALEHATGPVAVHVLLDKTVSEENRARLQDVVDACGGATLVLHEMDKLFRRQLRRMLLVRPGIAQARYTVATYYRLFLPEILAGGRVLYLDADTVVTCDIRKVLALPVGESGIAARPEPLTIDAIQPSSRGIVNPGHYFNAGVLLLDLPMLDAWCHGAKLFDRCVELLAHHPKEMEHDQDVLNHFFSESYEPLPPAAHMIVPARRRQGIQETPPGIYHFDALSLGMFRPRDVYEQMFYHYFAQTPWCDGAFLQRAFAAIRDAHPQRIPEAYGAQLIREL